MVQGTRSKVNQGAYQVIPTELVGLNTCDMFYNKSTWDSSRCTLACLSFLLSPSEVVAGVGVSLATHLLLLLLLLIFVISIPGTVARAGRPLAVHLFF